MHDGNHHHVRDQGDEGDPGAEVCWHHSDDNTIQSLSRYLPSTKERRQKVRVAGEDEKSCVLLSVQRK